MTTGTNTTIFADLLDNSAVATFVINPEHRVMYWNRPCEILTGLKASAVIGTDNHWRPFYESKRPCLADIVLSGRYDNLPGLYTRFRKSVLIPDGLHAEGWYQELGDQRRYIIFDAAPIRNSSGELVGVIETLQDITDKKSAEEEKEALILKLQHIIAETSAISGFVSICSSCKDIREENKWIPVEKYIMDRTEAKFTHSICPGCARKLYPELNLFPESA
ncbi:MAG: PAS domain-containing protein [Proteobacteria bacterium]|nr:PAS domain-containing protein [Pseudomonadota bacterium]MBU1739487.1 PAS domain-containing protein [Pseudomonadota bacterium]